MVVARTATVDHDQVRKSLLRLAGEAGVLRLQPQPLSPSVDFGTERGQQPENRNLVRGGQLHKPPEIARADGIAAPGGRVQYLRVEIGVPTEIRGLLVDPGAPIRGPMPPDGRELNLPAVGPPAEGR